MKILKMNRNDVHLVIGTLVYREPIKSLYINKAELSNFISLINFHCDHVEIDHLIPPPPKKENDDNDKY